MNTVSKALLTNDITMLLYGISAVLIGPTLPRIIAGFDLSLSAAGLIGTLQNVGGFVGALVALIIADRVSRPGVILVSFGLLAAALFSIGMAERYLSLLLAFAISGLFIRILDVMLNAHTGDLAPNESGKELSTLHMYFSIGAFAGPLLAGGLMRFGMSWSGVYQVVAIGYLMVLVVTAGLFRSYLSSGRGPKSDDPTEVDGQNAGAARPAIAVGLLSVLLFFYAIHQIGVVGWLPYYLEVGRGAAPDTANGSLSLYWIGIVFGRFLGARFVSRAGARNILFIGALIAAAASAAGVLVPVPPVAVAAFFLAGLASGGTIPLAYSVGYEMVPRRSGSVTAWMAIIMLAGRALGPWVIGVVADSLTLLVAMLIPAVALVGTGVLGACLGCIATTRVVSETRAT